VMLDGRTQQADTPQRLFESPANLFVAGYIGFPAMNFAEARLVRDDGPTVTFAGHALPVNRAPERAARVRGLPVILEPETASW